MPNAPPWFQVAIAEMDAGIREIRGPEHNARIVEYHSTTGYGAKDDETAWCSAFVNWCMDRVGIKGTNRVNARSWLSWGMALDEPRYGCVVVLWRESKQSHKGHVGFYVGPDEMHKGRIRLLGGNQGNAVNVSSYPKTRVLGYRWPADKSHA